MRSDNGAGETGPCEICLWVTDATELSLKYLRFIALSGIATFIGRRVICYQVHDTTQKVQFNQVDVSVCVFASLNTLE